MTQTLSPVSEVSEPVYVVIRYRSAKRTVLESEWQSTCEAMIAALGPATPTDYPQVERLTPGSTQATAAAVIASLPRTLPAPPLAAPARALSVVPAPRPAEPVRHADLDEWSSPGMSEEGRARSERDKAALLANGFSPADTIYERGMAVNAVGVKNSKAARLAFDDKPRVSSTCDDIQARVWTEERRTITLDRPSELRMSERGGLVLPSGEELLLTHDAFPQICTRLQLPGAGYLAQCWPALRAHNVNAWLEKRGSSRTTPQDPVVARTRNSPAGGRELFAMVSPSYAPFDADLVAEAIKLATPPDARGTVTYDGKRSRFEVLFHSTVEPEKYVCGEVFRAGVIISTDDTGGGSVRGRTVAWQNLCLNLLVIDQMEQPLFRLRHVGNVRRLAADFRQGFARALSKLDHFRAVWNDATEENIQETTALVAPEVRGMTLEEFLPGIFRAAIERELVPVGGSREEAVKGLMRSWRQDDSAAAGLTRAAVVNAVTRYAHTSPTVGRWDEDELQQRAGALLYGKNGARPAPLPWLAPDED